MMRLPGVAMLMILVEGLLAPPPATPGFIGRYHVNELGGVDFDQPGFQIHSRVSKATSIDVVMSKVGNITNWFVVHCSNEHGSLPATNFSTAGWPERSNVTVPLCANLAADMTHDVLILKSTEAQWNDISPSPNYMTFWEFVGSPEMQLSSSILPQRKIEFLGDSITAGFCNLCTDGGVDAESYADSWANTVCENLGAQCHVTAWSGYGVVRNCCGGEATMPDIFKRTLLSVPSDDSSDPHGTVKDNLWNFSAWKPDAVVINLGTNDHVDVHPELISSFNATLLDIVKSTADVYGAQTTFFLACGPMAEYYCDEVHWVIQQARAVNIKAELLDQRGFGIDTSCCWHPSVAIDAAMAVNTTRRIADVMQWSPKPILV